MLETTDIFYIVLAFCALWITAFLCWFIYQIAVMLKRMNDFLTVLKHQTEKIGHALDGIKEKFEAGSGHLNKLVGHVKTLVNKNIHS